MFRITRNMSSEDCFIFCSDDDITIRHLDQIVMKAQKLPFTLKEGEMIQFKSPDINMKLLKGEV